MSAAQALEEVRECQAKLEKQASGEQDVELVQDLLSTLDRLPINLDILRQTKIGKTVGKYKKSDDGDLAVQAKTLIKKWKAVAEGLDPSASQPRSTTSPPAKEEGEQSSSSAKEASQATTTPATANAPAAMPEEWNALLPRRRLVRQRLARALGKVATNGDDANAKASEVEEALHELHHADEADAEYQAKFRILFTNLQSNEGLARDVLGPSLGCAEFVRMSSVDMLSAEVRRERAQVQQMNREAISLDWEQKNRDKIYKDLGIEGGVGQYPCPKCKSKNTSYYLKQTRSADEPMTVFCSCDDCRNRWRIAG